MKADPSDAPDDGIAPLDFEAFFEVSLDMLCVRDREGRFVRVNPAWTTSLGYSRDELEGSYLLSLIHPDDVETTLAEMERVRTEGAGHPRFINRYRHRDGTYRHLEWRARQVGDYVSAVARDVSDRIADEQERGRLVAELEARRTRLEAVQTVAKIGSWEIDFRSGETIWSAEMHRIFETDPNAPPPSFRAILEIMHPDDREAAVVAFSHSRQVPSDLVLQYRLMLAGGRTRYVEERWQSGGDDTGQRARGTCQDITERHEMLETSRLQLERALSATEAILDNLYDVICTVDREGCFVRVNRRAQQLWGYAAGELIGVPFLNLVHPDDRPSTSDMVARVVAGSPAGGHINRNLCKDGSFLPMMWSATWSGDHETIFAVARDIREHLSAEERFRQSEKMAAVGRLTGGMAHDFNNLLTVIIGSTEELTAALGGRPELQALSLLSLDAAEQGAEVIKRLLAYARNQPLASEAVDCNQVLESLQKLVRSTFTEDIEVVLGPAPDALFCLVDATQLTTALLNLCINARDAMPNGGTLAIRIARAHLEPGGGSVDPGSSSYAQFIVEDTGQGMSAETKAQAAEPFFTTKSLGRGSGLGLSMVHGFVSQSGGRMQIDSELGAGTRISIWLPEVLPDPSHSPAPAKEVETAPVPTGARILLVEDDVLIRSQAERQLRAMGHFVTTASDGGEALGLLQTAPRFDLLLTDVVMPNGLNGHELAERARAINPELRILLSSGHSEDQVLQGTGRRLGVAFLPKPYRRADLERKIAQLLLGAPTANL